MGRISGGVLLAAAVGAFAVSVQADEAAAKKPPRVEVVFCLDTTGSMAQLIEGAKQKIWSISNQIAGGRPTPALKIGLVAYRDRTDKYVTQVFDLTDDLDAVYEKLRTFRAEGGGDEPESVNQALHEAVTKVSWSKDAGTLKIIFLVGDAPPHMDYKDDVKYPETCRLACEKGIIINTIQCGNNPRTVSHWREIADKAEGRYVQIAQDGGTVVIKTPYDKELQKINAELGRSILVFGDRDKRMADEAKKESVIALPAPAAAERAGFAGKGGKAAAYDLLDAVKSGQVQLESLKPEELPDELKNLTLAQRRQYLTDLDKKREELRQRALELDKKRLAYIAQKQAEQRAQGQKDGLDEKVLEILRQQAAKYKIAY
jgi:Mg-chelatase subunit ChlD